MKTKLYNFSLSFSVAEPFMPTKYSKYVKKFASGKDCHKIKCGSLF
jgi:hypothetical protein